MNEEQLQKLIKKLHAIQKINGRFKETEQEVLTLIGDFLNSFQRTSSQRQKVLRDTDESFGQKLERQRELTKKSEAQLSSLSLSSHKLEQLSHNLEQLLQNSEKLLAEMRDSSIRFETERHQCPSDIEKLFYNTLNRNYRQSEDAPKDILVLIRLRREDLDKMPARRDWVIQDTLSDTNADLRKMSGQILPESCKCSEWASICLKVEKVELLKLMAGEIAKKIAGIWLIQVGVCDTKSGGIGII
ncbi:hypothetical protein [Microcoleus sp.]|uniref:hypothetical protein n=1 Tax=Microcoleus sp. TaxID=44472 RepID=UPI003524D7A9